MKHAPRSPVLLALCAILFIGGAAGAVVRELATEELASETKKPSGHPLPTSDSDPPSKELQPALYVANLPRVPKMAEPRHWSASPQMTEGSQVLSTHFIRFQPAGAKQGVPAKVFLIEMRPPQKFQDERAKQGKPPIPGMIFATGFEIDAGDQKAFEPAFDVGPENVFPSPTGQGYDVQIGHVKFRVTAVPR